MKTKPKKRKLTQAQKSRKPFNRDRVIDEMMQKKFEQEHARIAELLSRPFNLSMEFNLDEAFKKVGAFFTENGLDMGEFNHNIYVPEMVVIEAYNQCDLIIALKMQQAKCSNWVIGTDTHFYNQEKNDVLTVPYQFKLNDVHYHDIFADQVKSKGKTKIEREGGFVTRWKGLHNELEDVYKKEVPAGYAKARTEIKITGECYFVSYQAYTEFMTMQALAEQGQLIPMLQNMNSKMRIDGILDEQMQPVLKSDPEGIPMSAFDNLIRERSKHIKAIDSWWMTKAA